jgi:hypothetical protein
MGAPLALYNELHLILTGVMTSCIVARLGSFASPDDPLVLMSVGVAMVINAVQATLIPARRANL